MAARNRWPRACAVAGLLLLCACGSDSNGTAPTPVVPTPAPPPAAPQTVFQRSFSLPPESAVAIELTTERAGTIQVVVDYTFAASEVVLLLANGRCTEEMLNSDQCTFAATAFEGPKPRTLSLPGAAAGLYTLIVANLSEQDESVVIQVNFALSAAGAADGVVLKSRTQGPGHFQRHFVAGDPVPTSGGIE